MENIAHIFSYPKYKIVEFLVDGTIGSSFSQLTILTFKISCRNKTNHYFNFHRILAKYIPGKQEIIISCIVQYRTLLADVSPLGSIIFQTILRKIILNESSEESKEKLAKADKFFQSHYFPYVRFIRENHMNGREKCKEMIKSLEDVPKFAKSLGLKDEDLFKLLCNFLSSHACEYRGCGGFSYLKCGGCLDAHYCNARCQERDFSRHKDKCSERGKFRARIMAIPCTLEVVLEHTYQEPIIRFETFIRVLQVRVYEAFHGMLKTTALSQLLPSRCHEKMLCLVKRRKNRPTVPCFRSQLEKAFGHKNMFAIFFEKACHLPWDWQSSENVKIVREVFKLKKKYEKFHTSFSTYWF